MVLGNILPEIIVAIIVGRSRSVALAVEFMIVVSVANNVV